MREEGVCLLTWYFHLFFFFFWTHKNNLMRFLFKISYICKFQFLFVFIYLKYTIYYLNWESYGLVFHTNHVSKNFVFFHFKFSCYNSSYNCTNALALLIIEKEISFIVLSSFLIYTLRLSIVQYQFYIVVSFYRKCLFFLLLFSLVALLFHFSVSFFFLLLIFQRIQIC